MRRHNLSLVLREVLDSPVPVSRSELAAATGLTRATVSSLVEVLLAADLLGELAPVTPQGAGRPAVPLVPARGTVAAIGMVLNVDYLGVRAMDLSGDVLVDHIERDDFRGSDPEAVMGRAGQMLQRVVDHLQGNTRLAGAGLALPGLVAKTSRTLRLAPNLGWREVDLNRFLEQPPFAGLRVAVGNEANLAARAEIRARGEDAPNFVYVNGEVGVGGAMVQGGEVFVGPRGGAGEIGHVCIEPDGPACHCGSTGCLEQYAGMDAILDAAGLPRGTPPHALAARALADDTRVQAAVERAGWALGIALANTFNMVAVNRVVLAGSFAAIAELVQPATEAQLQRRVMLSPWVPPRIDVAVAGENAAMTGAALAAFDDVVADPAAWGAAATPA
ncbi:transcriptional regulator [Egicoccus halophilus]|uniref:Transcriptional regulator n=2 Tax=Egicoccus halophilus TaxID=1670830 RepID=A0A8J3AB67_9ACTN|nr:transcriptional regulator [Egicoccus halophilus]